jgi:arylsulfatase A-like enzyme
MTSDHGDMGGQHGLMHKQSPYEENLRIPLAMSLPGTIPPNSLVSCDVSQIDLAPTIFGMLGQEPDPQWKGEDLLPYIAERSAPAVRDCFSQYNLGPDWSFHGVENWRLIVRRPWKYIYHKFYGPELYNSESDPWEIENLAGKSEESTRVGKALHDVLIDWMERTGDPMLKRMESVAL